MIANKVKLVIWDLDETFWRGTLSEEGITVIPANAERVRALSHRGIVNSICSKNDHEIAKAKLTELGVWGHFVFPCISFSPKGKAVAGLIESAALRAENVLFIDDNPSNVEEVKFFNPGIMAGHPDHLLEGLLDHPNLAGKPDPELTRLRQYQLLQRKSDERTSSDLSNEEFLRACDIRVSIDYDVETNFERVVELINRANQLNFTKKRVETPEAAEELKSLLDTFGYFAGCVHATDAYGDYGLIGFFLGQKRPGIHRLVHFVFSCRTMNMGIEQYVFDMLGRPELDTVEPVSYGVAPHEKIDWINVDADARRTTTIAKGGKLVLLGGCEMLQLASYCSTDRLEFVNSEKNGQKLRFDDPSFVLNDRDAMRNCDVASRFPCWDYQDALRFDEGIASARLILVSLWPGMNSGYYQVAPGVNYRLNKGLLKLMGEDQAWFERNFKYIELDDAAKLEMIERALDAMAAKVRGDARIFCMGCYTRGVEKEKRAVRRKRYNRAVRRYCRERPELFEFVDVDSIVPTDTLVDEGHYSRRGVFALAQYILGAAERGPRKRQMVLRKKARWEQEERKQKKRRQREQAGAAVEASVGNPGI